MKPNIPVLISQINKARAALNLAPISKLPKGEPCTAASCPVALALGKRAFVDGETLDFKTERDARAVAAAWHAARLNDGGSVYTPRNMANFIEAFDDREFPELIK